MHGLHACVWHVCACHAARMHAAQGRHTRTLLMCAALDAQSEMASCSCVPLLQRDDEIAHLYRSCTRSRR